MKKKNQRPAAGYPKPYWDLRRQNLSKPLGKRRVADILCRALEELNRGFPTQLKGLEIGCGEAHLLNLIRTEIDTRNSEWELWGLDRDTEALERAEAQYSEFRFVKRDLLHDWQSGLGLGLFDFVVAVNVFHEMLSEHLDREHPDTTVPQLHAARESITNSLLTIRNVMAANGLLVVFDGVEADGTDPVEISLKSDPSRHAYERFRQEYDFCEGLPRLGPEGSVLISQQVLARFLSKLNSFFDGTWDIERHELYQVFVFEELLESLQSAGFGIMLAERLVCDYSSWMEHVAPADRSFRMPYQHVLVVASCRT